MNFLEIGIIADTHIDLNDEYSALMGRLEEVFSNCDLIIHAGDVCNEKFLVDLQKLAPIEAVVGNMDDSTIFKKYPDYKLLELENVRIGVSHQEPSLSFIKQENLKIVISGHTHVPMIKEHEDGILFLNPGSTTYPRSPPIRKQYQKIRPPTPSVMILNIDEEISSAYIVSFKFENY